MSAQILLVHSFDTYGTFGTFDTFRINFFHTFLAGVFRIVLEGCELAIFAYFFYA